ncbi:AP-5 complex subunit beta-1 [Struthio camelus]|uniref:AP-5 complex subunit beta-1 n=1 Tax=Struthio camelus TaxID=8801 RepID=UPI00360418D1
MAPGAAEAWARLGAALGGGDHRDPPAVRALRGPAPARRHQVSVLWLLLESPSSVCPSRAAGEEAAGALLALLALPEPPGPPRALLLLATATVLVATGAAAAPTAAAFVSLLLRPDEPRPAAAAECLRELQAARPGLLSGRPPPPLPARGRPPPAPLALLLAAAPAPGAVPALLDGAFLQPAAAQAQALWALSRAAVPAPAVFKAPLVRLLGTGEAALLHAALHLKAAFGDALFTAEDEAFLLRRLAGLAQHPALPPPRRLFFLECVAAFPENRPLGAGGPPVLLTPRLAAGLFPGRLDAPPGALLARYELAAAVCAENGGRDAERGGSCLRQLALELAAAGPPAAGLFCGAAALYAAHLGADAALAAAAAGLFLRRPALAPALLDLAKAAGGSGWPAALGAALRQAVLGAPPPAGPELRWHLRVLARAPGGGGGGRAEAARYLRRAAAAAGGDWRGGHAVLTAAARLLPAPPPPPPAADADVRDRARLYGALAACLSPAKLQAVTRRGGGLPARPRGLSAPAAAGAAAATAPRPRPAAEPAPLLLRRLPEPPRPVAAAPADAAAAGPAGYGRAAARRRAAPGLRLRLQVEPGPQRLLAVQLRFEAEGGAVAEARLAAVGPAAEVAVALRPRGGRPVAVGAAFTAPGGRALAARLPPLPLAPGELLWPLALPPGWGPSRRRRAFGAMWQALAEAGAETALPRAGPGLPPALAAFAVAWDGGDGDGWLVAAALPGRGLALAWLRGPRVAARAARWAALAPLGCFLRRAGAAAA